MDIRNWSLQLFGEGGEGAAAPGGETAEGQQAEVQQEKLSFDDLLKDADYSKEFEKRVQRRSGYEVRKAAQAERQKMTPMYEALARKYGMDVSDPGKIDLDMLSQKVLDDNDMLEEEAAQLGVSADGLRKIRNAEYQLRQAEAIRAEQESQRAMQALIMEGDQLKQIYPGFDLEQELSNDQFRSVLASLQASGFQNPLRTVFETFHKDEILGGAMQYAVQKTKQQMSNSIQAGMNRPAENGGTQAAAQSRIDPSKLTRQQIEELRRRAAAGERITFS